MSPTLHGIVQQSQTHKAIIFVQFKTFAVYPHPHILLQNHFSAFIEPIPFEIVMYVLVHAPFESGHEQYLNLQLTLTSTNWSSVHTRTLLPMLFQ